MGLGLAVFLTSIFSAHIFSSLRFLLHHLKFNNGVYLMQPQRTGFPSVQLFPLLQPAHLSLTLQHAYYGRLCFNQAGE